jgi:protein-S-isoprenylcysteine O-methyltransferase Ste14
VSSVFLAGYPSPAFANIFVVTVLLAVLLDEIMPRLSGARARFWRQGRDHASFLVIQLGALTGFFVIVYLRYQGIAGMSPWIQVFALGLLIFGTRLREWAVFLPGRFFSRTVEIEQDYRLITDGPYRWIRRQAYTGMLIMDASIALGLGTWAGVLFMLCITLFASLYRIRVEARVLIEAFGDASRAYMKRTWRLFPAW